jgi:hypothetical protein
MQWGREMRDASGVSQTKPAPRAFLWMGRAGFEPTRFGL